MPKTPKFIIHMKSQPRSPKHGNRKPSPKVYGNPVDGAGTGNDRADAFAYAPGSAFPFGAVNSDPRVTPDHMRQTLLQMMILSIPEPSEIPHAGIRAGEIIGWRLWWVNH